MYVCLFFYIDKEAEPLPFLYYTGRIAVIAELASIAIAHMITKGIVCALKWRHTINEKGDDF